jgi:hypothetical protein
MIQMIVYSMKNFMLLLRGQTGRIALKRKADDADNPPSSRFCPETLVGLCEARDHVIIPGWVARAPNQSVTEQL